MARNKLSGTLSRALKSRQFLEFDVSHNKIAGSVSFANSVNYQSNRTYKVAVNRLTGSLPSKQLEYIGQIDVLTGNMFQCTSDNDLPANDPGLSVYSCGSVAFDYSMISFFWIFGPVVAILFMIYFGKIKKEISSLQFFQNVSATYDKTKSYLLIVNNESFCQHFPNTAKFLRALRDILKLTVLLFLVSFVISMVFYGALKYGDTELKYSTHENEYSWLFSAAYFSGYPAAIGLLCIYLVNSFIMIVWSLKAKRPEEAIAPIWSNFREACRVSIIYVCIVVLSCGISVSIYIGYVAGALYLSARQFAVLQFFISIAVVLWKNILCPILLSSSFEYFQLSSADLLPLATFVTCFSTVLAPVTAILAIDPNCFRDLLFGTQSVTYISVQTQCTATLFRGQCLDYDTFLIPRTATPSFVYNNECYSSVIVQLSPIILYSSLLTSIILIVYCLLAIVPYSKIPLIVLDNLVPSIIWPERFQLLDTLYVIMWITNNVLSLITFGVLVPPVAVALVFNVITITGFWIAAIGRFCMRLIDESKGSSMGSGMGSSMAGDAGAPTGCMEGSLVRERESELTLKIVGDRKGEEEGERSSEMTKVSGSGHAKTAAKEGQINESANRGTIIAEVKTDKNFEENDGDKSNARMSIDCNRVRNNFSSAKGSLMSLERELMTRTLERNCRDFARFLPKIVLNSLFVAALFYAFVIADQVLDREILSPGVEVLAICPLIVPLVYQWIAVPLARRTLQKMTNHLNEPDHQQTALELNLNDVIEGKARDSIAIAIRSPLLEKVNNDL